MLILKKIILSFSFIAHGLTFGAQVDSNIPKEITLVCDDEERIEQVDVKSLMNNFGFFQRYFQNWDNFPRSSDTELRVHGSVDAMSYLLVFVSNFNVAGGIEYVVDEPGAVSLVILADQLLLKKELMDCFKEEHGDAIYKELHSSPAYEKFLRGDRETVLCAWAVDKKFTPAPIFEPEFRHSTAGYEEDQRDLRRQRQEQEAAERKVREEEYRIETQRREEEHRRKAHGREEEHRRRMHEIGEESRRTLNAILSLPYYPLPYYPSTYVPAYSHSSHNQSVQTLRSSSLLLPSRPRPASIFTDQPRPRSSFFTEQEKREKQRRKETLLFWGGRSSSKMHSVQQEETFEKTFSRIRVRPTVFSEDGARGLGFSATRIYVYDDAEHLLFEHSFSLGKCRQGYAIKEVVFDGAVKLRVIFKKKVPDSENSYYTHEETIHLPSSESIKILAACTDEERYLYHALRFKIKDTGTRFDRLSLSSSELEEMFDRLPRISRSEILTKEGRRERVIAKQVVGIYERMKSSSENKCRELQVYKPV